MKINIELNDEVICEFVCDFWDWMHENWQSSSNFDGCAQAKDDETFKEKVYEFFFSLNKPR
jgi:hypothetical protein